MEQKTSIGYLVAFPSLTIPPEPDSQSFYYFRVYQVLDPKTEIRTNPAILSGDAVKAGDSLHHVREIGYFKIDEGDFLAQPNMAFKRIKEGIEGVVKQN